MDDPELWGQVIAAGAVALIVAATILIGRRVAVTTQSVTYTAGTDPQRTLAAGTVIPRDEVGLVPAGSRTSVRRSWFTGIVVGKDHRTSTSKSVAFAWTLAIAWGLLALLVAKWCGFRAGWEAFTEQGLREEYLLLLGGPYAAAIIAKMQATSNANAGNATGTPGEATPAQIVTDDAGDTDLVDFQYVLFNLIALAYFLGDFIGRLELGFPELPPVLTGLALTSAAGYSAKKLVAQLRPTLTAVLPVSALPGADDVKVYGTNLVVPASVSPTGAPLAPAVAVGGQPAEVTAHEQILGADVLTVKVSGTATPGSGTVTVVRADGAAAVGPAGSQGLPFTIAEQPPPTPPE